MREEGMRTVLMKGGLGFAAILGAMLGPAIARAEGTSCTDPTIIVPDGRITASTIPPGQTFYFKVSSRVGSSYSAEFHNTLGPGSQTPGTLIVYSDAGCTVSITPASTSSVDPGDDNGVRVAFTATTAQSRFALDNTAGSPITYSFSVSDTTMFSRSRRTASRSTPTARRAPTRRPWRQCVTRQGPRGSPTTDLRVRSWRRPRSPTSRSPRRRISSRSSSCPSAS